MISAAYRCLTELGAPLISFYLKRRLLAGREDGPRFGERLGIPSAPRPEGFLIWCHAASIGEATSLLSLIDKLREKYPFVNILMTTGTVTSARMLDGRLPPQVIHQYVPVDRIPYVQKFVKHWRPDLVIWVESELWPNMLQEIREHKTPTVLLNGRMSDKSFRQWYRFRGWAKEILSTFSLCLTQTEAERGRFVTLGAKPVHCIGNLKYAAHPLPYDPQEYKTLGTKLIGRYIWLMASTHKGEEEIAATAHKEIKKTNPKLLTIIVPRHANRGNEVMDKLIAAGLSVARRSKGEEITPATDVYLADTMSELGLFYRLSPVVAMGGSFASNVGGHNPVEPAQLSCALVFGPTMFNFSEITREFLYRRAALQLNHSNELAYTIDYLLTDLAEREMLAKNALLLAEDKAHVLNEILKELKPWLPAYSGAEIRGTGT
jgi:3-deoxy-D-manno-octulosonic-acid transferase